MRVVFSHTPKEKIGKKEIFLGFFWCGVMKLCGKKKFMMPKKLMEKLTS
jgi:hypothetical protein